MMEVVVITGAITRAKLQLNRHHQQTNTKLFTVQMPFLLTNHTHTHTLHFNGLFSRWTWVSRLPP